MSAKRNSKMIGAYSSDTYYCDDKPISRVCTHCGMLLPIESYHRNGVDEQGRPAYRLECKTCYNAKRKENRVKNKHGEFISHQKTRGEEAPALTYTEWRECVIFFKGSCCYCGATTKKGQTLTRDHLVAVSNGGKTEQVNIVPACASCNSSKGKQDWRDWFMKQPFFSQDRMNAIFKWRAIITAAGGGYDE